MQVDELCRNFDTYLDEFNNSSPFRHSWWYCHKRTIDLRKELGGVAESIDSDEYLNALYSTLEVWGMNRAWRSNSKGSKMQEYDVFAASVRAHKRDVADMDRVGLAEIDAYTTREDLWQIIDGMQLSQRKPSQTVTGSKALHHLLPRLLPPIDRGFTRRFFRYNGHWFQYNQEDAFKEMIPYFAQIAKEVEKKQGLGRYVGTAKWATSESKMIDNAIIGYCLKHSDRLPK